VTRKDFCNWNRMEPSCSTKRPCPNAATGKALARLGRAISTLVPFSTLAHQSTFLLSSSGGGLPGRLATRTESRRLFYFGETPAWLGRQAIST